MRRLLERPARTVTIDVVALTEEVEAIDRRLPVVADQLARVAPEQAIASGLLDPQRLATVNDRISQLEAERSTLATRRDEIMATLRSARDAELTTWERERWQPAIVAIQRERAARMARCRELADALVAALEDVKQHPHEVVSQLDQIEAERWTIAGRFDAVPGGIDRPARPGETAIDYADWKRLIRDVDATLNPTRQGIPLVIG